MTFKILKLEYVLIIHKILKSLNLRQKSFTNKFFFTKILFFESYNLCIDIYLDSKPNKYSDEELNNNDDDRSSDTLYDYNGEEIRQISNNQNDDSSRHIQDSYEELINKNKANIKSNQNRNNDNNEDYSLDLQRSRSVVTNSQDRNFGTIGIK